jgi:hypothetical protein
MKSILNWISYHGEFFQIFIPSLAICLVLRFDFRLYLNLEIPSSGVHLSATSSPSRPGPHASHLPA